MKKKFILVFCLISLLGFSQNMSFDYLLEKATIIGEKHTSYQFYNSKTQQFFFLRKHNQKFIGSLYDFEKKLLHYFYIYEKDGNYTSIYSDSYVHDSLFKVTNEANKFEDQYNIEIRKVENLHYAISIFDQKKSKKIITSIDVYLEKSEFNFLEIFVDSPERHYISKVFENEMNKNECCYRIAKYSIIYRKNVQESVTNNFKKVDFKITVPNKLNIKSLKYLNSQ